MATLKASCSSSFSSSSFSNTKWIYDVFLSFRGEDTRNSFTDHLYTALQREGIFTFRDDEGLERGKPISPKLLQAIKESRIALVVLSRNYASSTWCLDELATIVDCRKEMGQTVLPIFYDVDPSEVQKQTGSFAKAFDAHEERFKDNLEKVKRWRNALTEVANLSGFPSQDRQESELIKAIIGQIVSDLSTTHSIVSKDLIGIDSRVEEVKELCFGIENENDVGFIGIWGMGGIGKTTLARAFYEKVSNQFQARSFVNNVRELSEKDGLVSLQEMLLSNLRIESVTRIWDVHRGINEIKHRLRHKDVLIILDDVDKIEQLEALAGSKDWFGRGSRIIITTRNEHLLKAHGVDKIYKAKELEDGEAMKLFSWKAFKNDHPPTDYMELSCDFVNYAKGLPLAIEVLGPLLCCKNEIEWKSAFTRLKGSSEEKIMNVLLIGFDGLHEKEKEIFLDIACFFKGKDKDHVTNILDSFGFEPVYGIGVLIDKALLTVVGRKLWMHDLLQEMGWEIVRKQCPKEPGNRSRLWHCDDVLDVLKYNKGTEAVEGIVLNWPQQKITELDCEAFSRMKRLRLLKICDVLLPGGLNYLSTNLGVIEWRGYPLNLLPPDFPSSQLFELSMCCSSIKQLWKGYKALDKLKSIELGDSQSLIETPDFSGVPNLQRLILQGCTKLSKVHPSIGSLKRLIILNMKNCKSLKSLQCDISLESLETFILSGCLILKRFPEIVGDMKCLSKLYLDGTAIHELPSSLESLTSLIFLDLSNCKNLLRLPSVISSLTSLKTVILSGCSSLEQIPENIGSVECLEELDVSGTALRQAPSSILLLKNLKRLSFSGCTDQLHSRPLILMIFSCLSSTECPRMGLSLPPSFSGLTSLIKLNLSYCNLLDGGIPNDLDSLPSLRSLDLSGNNFANIPDSICRLSVLRELSLRNCSKLQSLPKLPISILFVWSEGCTLLNRDSDQIEVWTSSKTGLAINSRSKLPGPQDFRMRKVLVSEAQALLMFESNNLEAEISHTNVTLGSSVLAKIPEWFTNRSSNSSVTIDLLTELDNNSEWTGFALYFGFVVHEHDNNVLGIFDGTDTNRCDSGDFHKFSCHFDFNDGGQKETVNLDIPKVPIAGPHGFWVHIPRSWFSKWLSTINKLSSTEVTMTTDSSGVKVKMCGARLLYEQEATEFAQVIRQCSLGSSLAEYVSSIRSSSTEAESNESVPLRHDCNKRDCTSSKFGSARSSSSSTHLAMLEDDQGYETDSTIPLKDRLESLLLQCYEGHYARKKMYKYVFPGRSIPAWFSDTVATGCQVGLELPRNLYHDKRWIGFALYVSFADRNHSVISHGTLNSDSPFFLFGMLDTSRSESLDPFILFPVTRDAFNSESHGLLLLHIPREFFSHKLNQRGYIRATFSTMFTSAEVERCLIHPVYEQDKEGLIHSIVTSILRSPDAYHHRYYQSLIDQVNSLPNYAQEPIFTKDFDPCQGPPSSSNTDRTSSFSLQRGSSTTGCLEKPSSTSFDTFQGQVGGTIRDSKLATDNVPEGHEGSFTGLAKSSLEACLRERFHDLADECHVYNECFAQCEIPEWFCIHNGPSTTFKLLPNMHCIPDWKGIAFCAFFTILKHPTLIIDNLDMGDTHDIAYNLETNTDWKPRSYFHHITESKNNKPIWSNRRGFIWISYIPRSKFEDDPLINCNFMRVIFRSKSDDLLVRKCGHQFVFHQNVDDLVQTIIQCSIPFLDNPEINHQSFVADDSQYEQSHDDEETSNQLDRAELVRNRFMNLLRGFCQDIHPYFIHDSCYPPSDIPLWFSHRERGPSTTIQLPPNLFDDPYWMGFALCASFSAQGNPTTTVDILDSKFSHHLICHFETSSAESLHVYHTTKEEFKWLYLRGFNWLFYVPRWSAFSSDQLHGCSLIKVSIVSDCPGFYVHKFGLRIVFKNDAQQLSVPIPMHCAASHFDNWDVIRKCAVEKDFTFSDIFSNKRTESALESSSSMSNIKPETFGLDCLQSKLLFPTAYEPYKIDFILLLKRNLENLLQKSSQDFGVYPIHNSCFPPCEIVEFWFSNCQIGPSVTIPLPPDLYNDSDWMGLVLFATFSVPENPTFLRSGIDSKHSDFNLICRLEPESPEPLHVHCTSNEEFMWLYLGGLTWISYIPRGSFLDQWSQCNLIEASFACGFRDLTVQKCGLRLLHRQDVIKYETMRIQCLCLLLEKLDSTHQQFSNKLRSQKRSYLYNGWEPGTSGTGNSYVDSSDLAAILSQITSTSSSSSETALTIPLKERLESLLLQCHEGHYPRKKLYKYVFPGKSLPPWCRDRGNIGPVGFQQVDLMLPPNLYDDESWIGFSLSVIFADHDHPVVSRGSSNSDVSFSFFILFDTCGDSLDPFIVFPVTKDAYNFESHGLLLIHVPRQFFSHKMNEWGFIRAMFTPITGPAAVQVERCGIRLVYEQDQEGFIRSVVNCVLRSPAAYHQRYYQSLIDQVSYLPSYADEPNLPRGHDYLRQTNEESSSEIGRQLHDRPQLVAKKSEDLLSRFCQVIQPYEIYNSCFPPSDIPLWFSRLETGPSMNVQLPPNLYDDPNWMGFALCVSFSVQEDPTTTVDILDSTFSHNLICLFETNSHEEPLHHVYHTTKEELNWLYLRGFIWLFYIPRWSSFSSDQLNGCNCIKVSVVSNCPGVKVHKCGFRIVYLKDEEHLSNVSLHCTASFFDNWDLVRRHAAEKDSTLLEIFSNQRTECASESSSSNSNIWDESRGSQSVRPMEEHHKIELILRLKRNVENLLQKFQDFEPHLVHNSCFHPSKIMEWHFKHHCETEPSVTVPLPLGLYNDNDWMGLILCASFSVLQHPTTILGNPDSKVSRNLICRLEPEGREPLHVHCLSDEDLMWLYLGGLTWISYIPRGSFLDQWNQCSRIQASFASDCQGLIVEKCGFRLLYHRDVMEFKITTMQCLSSFLDRSDRTLANKEGSKKQSHDNENEKPSGTDNSYKESIHFGRHDDSNLGKLRRPIYHGETSGTSYSYEDPCSEIRLCKNDLLAFDRRCAYNFCFPSSEILDWFNHYHSDHPTLAVQLPQHLYNDSNWVGLAVCASFSVHDHPIDLDNSEASHNMYCHFQTDHENGSASHLHSYHLTKEDMALLREGELIIWTFYIPHMSFSESLNKCSGFDASFASDHPSLMLNKSGFRLVYLHNEVEFKKLISHCLALMTEKDCTNRSTVDVNEKSLDYEKGTNKSGSSNENLDPEKRRPIDGDKGKRIQED